MRLENDLHNENENLFDSHSTRQSSFNNNPVNSTTRLKYVFIRGGVIAVGLVAIVLNSIYGYALPHSHIDCIKDYSLSATTSLNNYFAQDTQAKFLLLIFSSLCVDFLMLTLGLMWITHGKSWRVFVTLVSFYLFKLLIQLIFQERTPEGYLWEYPGFPSIMVSYLNTNTLFFSTSTGFITIAALEFWKMDNKYIFSFALVVLFLDMITRNFLRGNYIIDLVSAIIVAHFIFILADDYCPKYLDCVNNEWFKLNHEEEEEDDLAMKGYAPVNNKEGEYENKERIY